MEGFFNILADNYIILIIITVIIILALIGYNSIKNEDFVIKNDMRSNRPTKELTDLKKDVAGKSMSETINSNQFSSTNIPTNNIGVNNEVEKL